MSSQALVKVENELAVRDQFGSGHAIKEYVERFNMLVEFVKTVMKKDVDFGTIPGTDKPTLLKPGAEKLNTFFHLRAIPELVSKVEDWAGGFFYYQYRSNIYKGDTLVCAAEGSANSKEKKYRWRNVPSWKATEDDKRQALRQEQRTGKGGKSYTVYVIENTEPFDIVNTLQKMAQKRALVAATLLAVNASEFFTQDIEDMAIDAEWEEVAPEPQQRPQQTTRERQTAPTKTPEPPEAPAEPQEPYSNDRQKIIDNILKLKKKDCKLLGIEYTFDMSDFEGKDEAYLKKIGANIKDTYTSRLKSRIATAYEGIVKYDPQAAMPDLDGKNVSQLEQIHETARAALISVQQRVIDEE